MTHAHITTWVIALILFFVALSLHKSGNAKGTKIVQMILRLFYLLIIATGGWLLHGISNIGLLYVLKALVGVWVIAMLEMIIVRSVKQKSTKVLWIQLIVALVLVIYLGLKLPQGLYFF